MLLRTAIDNIEKEESDSRAKYLLFICTWHILFDPSSMLLLFEFKFVLDIVQISKSNARDILLRALQYFKQMDTVR